MSDYHVLTQSIDQKTVNVVFHIPIPAAGTNDANVSWQNALVMSLGGTASITSVLHNIDSQELTDMQAGAIYEVFESYRFTRLGLTPQQKQTEIEGRFADLKNQLVNDKQIELQWTGQQGNVP
jgi:hypothetical protein